MNRIELGAVICAVLCFITAQNVYADANTLKGNALKNTISGKTLHIATPYGIVLPIRFRRNGTMVGKGVGLMKFVKADESYNDRGVWWISNDRLCQRWRKWLGGKRFCFTLKRAGKKIFWRANDGRSGTARIIY